MPPVTQKLRNLTNHATTRLNFNSSQGLSPEFPGRSIRDEIIAVRIAKAKKLLADPYIAVNSIYAQCGYRDERSLRWVFTKATGMSPAAWRKRHRQG